MPPTKKTVSAASVFKQDPTSFKTAIKLQNPRSSTAKQLAHAKPDSHSSLERQEKDSSGNGDELHPLSVAFNNTTRAYRQSLLENATKKLDDTLAQLLAQLEDSNRATTSSPIQIFDPKDSSKKLTIADKADRTAEKLFTPIGSYQVIHANDSLQSEYHQTTQTLRDGLLEFRAKHESRLEEIRDLKKKWETVVGEIWKVGVKCMGEDAMSALLLKQPVCRPPAPAQVEKQNLILPDIKPKPARKKVKFEEPVPALPKFLLAPSVYPDLAVPVRISVADVKTLKDQVNVFGIEHIESIVKIKKDGQEWWERKQEQMMRVLKED